MRSIGLAALALAVASSFSARPAAARDESPLQGGVEVGGAAFVGIVEEAGVRRTGAGPLFHLGFRAPISPAIQLGLTGRFGLGSSSSGGRATGSFAVEGRFMGGQDIAPYVLLGMGVILQSQREVAFEQLAPEPRLAMPVGAGIETRLSETIMLGFAARYTPVLTHLDETTGPFDLAIYLTFL